jgi:hypothetical protein
MSQPAPDSNLVRENATCAHHSPDPLTDFSAEGNEVTVNVPPSPCPENSVCALCGISIAPLDPTTESPDQLTRVRHCKCAVNTSAGGHASLYDVRQDDENASAVAAGGWTAGELPAEGGVDGSDDFNADDYAWVDKWIEDGGDAAGFWTAPGEAGPLTGGIWSTPIGAGAPSADEVPADGEVATGDGIAPYTSN